MIDIVPPWLEPLAGLLGMSFALSESEEPCGSAGELVRTGRRPSVS